MKLKREFYNWSDKGYDLKIGGRKNMAVVNWVVDGNNNNSSLRIRINANIENFVSFKSTYIKRLIWLIYIKPMLQSYIDHVIKGFNHYMNKEVKVLSNQFGKHKWFS